MKYEISFCSKSKCWQTRFHVLMAWKEKVHVNDSYGNPTPKTKSSLKKLQEIVKSERLVINSVCRTSKPIQNGKNARKFPDSKRDFCVEFTVSSQTGKISLPICYEQFSGDEDTPVPRYTLAVTSIQRYLNSENKILNEEAGGLYYCCCPLLKHRAGSKKKLYGFWLRFFGRKVTFRITVAIKLCGLHHLTKRKALKVCSPVESDGHVVCSRVFEFVNSPRKAPKGQTINGSQPAAKIAPSLYTDEDYKEFMRTFKSINPGDLEAFLSQCVKKSSNQDLRVAAQLEQSRDACRRGQLEKAKQTVKGAVNLVSKCSSKVLLTGRAYLYLAEIHLKDGCLGNVEECLCLARKKLENIESCEDVGDLSYQEGQMLVIFIKRVPRLKTQLIPKARDKFQEAVFHYREGLSSGNALDKLCSSHIQLALLALQENKSHTRTNKLETAQGHVKLVQAHLANLSHQVKLNFFLCYSKLLLEMELLEQARGNLKTALEIAEGSVGGEESVLDSELVEEIYDQLHGGSSQHTEEHLEVVVKAMATLNDDEMVNFGYLGDVSE